MKRALALALLLAVTGRARADDVDDPRVLFASGRYASAATVFEHRWAAKGDANDGVNAVVSWRTAGRYARAASLLARVRTAKVPPTGAAATTAAELDERLQTLTAIATIDGTLDPAAVVRIDADPAERIGNDLVLDVGEHDIEIEQPGCDRFLWHTEAYPSAKLVVPFRPRCDEAGTLHVYLATAPGARFEVDGAAHATIQNEADVKLPPGDHRLVVEARDRPVYDERVDIRAHETRAVRVRYPWRAQGIGFVLGIGTELRGGQIMSGAGFGLLFGLWSSRFHASFEAGSIMNTAKSLNPGAGSPGRPWIADTFVYHPWGKPQWHGKLGAYRVAFDADLLGARFDEVREISYFGIRNGGDLFETRVRAWSALPLALSLDGPYVHTEITLWPISRLYYHPGDGSLTQTTETGWGAFLTVMGGWRL